MDAKIGSKAFARRLQEVIPDIIHHNQNTYVRGKSIFDAVRTIDDILEFTERKKIKGLMLAIDDSVNRRFMFETLSAFDFRPSFIRWIRTFYQNITSSVRCYGRFSLIIAINRKILNYILYLVSKDDDSVVKQVFLMSLDLYSSGKSSFYSNLVRISEFYNLPNFDPLLVTDAKPLFKVNATTIYITLAAYSGTLQKTRIL